MNLKWFAPLVGVVVVMSAPAAQAGLIITPTFDSSITSDANVALIEATINQAIGVYEDLFSNPIDVLITFQEGGGLGSSAFIPYRTSYSTFRQQLISRATDATDAAAIATLPAGSSNPVTGSGFVIAKSANLKALGYTGFSGQDGTITLNTALTDPGSPGTFDQYSLLGVTEHEIDEILGLGSTLGLGLSSPFNNDPSPEDFFRYDASGNRSFTQSSATAFFSINGTTDLAQFNNPNFSSCTPNCGDYGDWASGATVQIQNAFATAGAYPTLGTNEITALDAIGYTLGTPEPGTAGLLLAALAFAVPALRRRRTASNPLLR